MNADLPDESEILDLAMAKTDVLVSIKLSRNLIAPLRRVGKSWKCKTYTETIYRMLDTIENGGSSPISNLGEETRKFIQMHLVAGRKLPIICTLLNKKGMVAHDGGSWTAEKLSVYCKYHGIDYRRIP